MMNLGKPLANWKITMNFMGKLTINRLMAMFKFAFCMFTRGWDKPVPTGKSLEKQRWQFPMEKTMANHGEIHGNDGRKDGKT